MTMSMQAQKFFINSGINITVKTENFSYSRWRNHPPHHYAPPPNFTVFLTHWGDKRSLFFSLTNFLQSDQNKLNLDSSLKWTIFHCSSVHRICSGAKSRRTLWFFFEIKSSRHGIQATNCSLFNLRETVFLKIGFPVCSQNAREIDVAESKRSFKDILIIFRSSGLVVYWLHDKPSYDACNSEYNLPSWFAKMRFFSSHVKQISAFASILLKNSSNDVWQLTINQN